MQFELPTAELDCDLSQYIDIACGELYTLCTVAKYFLFVLVLMVPHFIVYSHVRYSYLQEQNSVSARALFTLHGIQELTGKYSTLCRSQVMWLHLH